MPIFARLLILGLTVTSTWAVAQAAGRTVVIGAVGDVMMGSNYGPGRIPKDPRSLLSSASPILQAVDIAFGNFEGTYGTEGESAKHGENSYAFRSPPEYAGYLGAAGFDVMSLANNHAMDFGAEGLKQTKAVLDRESIDHSDRYGGIAVFSVNGLKVAFLAASTYGRDRNITRPEKLFAEIKAEAIKYDIFVVSVHAGAEGSDKTHTPNHEEEMAGENRGNVIAFGRTAVDLGADLILMHGPHVPRGMEIYRDRLIAYSLGNFCTVGFALSGPLGYAPLLQVELDDQGRLLQGMIHSFVQKSGKGPQPDPSFRAAKLIQSLSRSDFRSNAPDFDESGGFAPAATNRLN